MSIQAKFWQTVRFVRKVGKLRGTITIPSFSAVCGNRSSLQIYNGSVVSFGNAIFVPTTAFTFSCWIKFQDIGVGESNNTAGAIVQSDVLRVCVKDGRIVLTLTTSDVYVLETNTTLLTDEWYKITVTFANSVAKIYINEKLDVTSPTLGTGIIQAPATNFYLSGGGAVGSGNPGAEAYISGLELWNIALSAQQINDNLYYLDYAPGAVGLKFQFQFREYTGTTIRDERTGTTYSLVTLGDPAATWVNDFPSDHLYNMSFIAGLFAVTATPAAFSLHYPVASRTITDALNFIMCVIAADGTRYKLWPDVSGNFRFAIGNLELYAGQKLSDDAVFEIWTLDGNETVDMADDLVIQSSVLHTVTDPTSIIRISDLTVAPTIDTTIADIFSLSLPVVFDQQPTYP